MSFLFSLSLALKLRGEVDRETLDPLGQGDVGDAGAAMSGTVSIPMLSLSPPHPPKLELKEQLPELPEKLLLSNRARPLF